MDDHVLMACTCDKCNRPSRARPLLMISVVGLIAWTLPDLLNLVGSFAG